MKNTCRKIQDTLAADGPQALRGNEAAQQHLAECDDCFGFLETLSEIEAGLGSMADEHDAPDEVVEALLARPEITTPPGAAHRVTRWLPQRPLAWGSIAAAFLLVAVTAGIGLQDLALRANRATEESTVLHDGAKSVPVQEREVEKLRSLGYLGDELVDRQVVTAVPETIDLDQTQQSTKFNEDFISDLKVPAVQDAGDDSDPTVHGSRSRDYRAEVGSVSKVDLYKDVSVSRVNPNSIEEMGVITSGAGVDISAEDKNRRIRPAKPKARPKPGSPAGPGLAGAGAVTNPLLIEESYVVPEYPELARVARLEAHVMLQVIVRADGSVDQPRILRCSRPEMGFEEAATDAVAQWRYEPARQGDKPVDVYFTIRVDFEFDEKPAESGAVAPLHDDAVRLARAFLEERTSVEGLVFKPATGYWSNTYVPGDPTLRLLQSRLVGSAYPAMQLHRASHRVGQPFDTPDGSALAVYLHTDRFGIAGESRMLVQVGIEGTPRHGGRRPAMNLALVLDMREEIPADVAIGVRSLLEEFNRAKEPGDRFRVFVAGRSGGCVVEPVDFRHGFLKVTLDRLIEEAAGAPALGVVDAVAQAIESVAQGDDPAAPLGSSAVVLITARPFGEATRSLADLAHQGAVAGIPLSVIGIGAEVEPTEIDLVTLAGQGNRRLLDDPSAAADLVDRELSAASRAIARAVRLRIRLAPGVKLIDVLGSERLDEARAERVRESERSVDLRLSRNLGIEADRGEDEDGIQIVIPNFYAGDSHVILLDVVAPGPGPLADVTVRYKDLVHLRNGISRASLDVGRDARPDGPLERNVVKNLLSFSLSRTLDEAGRALKANDGARARTLLDEFAALLDGLRRELPGLGNDPEVEADIAMLGEYRRLLDDGRPDRLDYLADSLRYAALLKVLPRPLETRS